MNNSRGFGSDNHSGVHPEILESLLSANSGHMPSYGTDVLSGQLSELCKKQFGPSCEVFPVFNGTAANVLCLSSLIESHNSVICARTSHLQMDECGAPEKHIGCKLILIDSPQGKITPEQIEKELIRLGDQHYSQPKAVSITLPTEYGTCYSLEELKALRKFTKENNLFLHIDGARFIYAPYYLGCSFYDLAEGLGIDAISFGGTKNGLLFGELCLLFNEKSKMNFKYRRKQSMQLPSKQRFISAQFLELLGEKAIWKQVAETASSLALYLAKEIADKVKSVEITQSTQANSVFAKVPKSWIKELRKTSFFYVWDEHSFEVRLMLSFDSTKKEIDQFINKMLELENV